MMEMDEGESDDLPENSLYKKSVFQKIYNKF